MIRLLFFGFAFSFCAISSAQDIFLVCSPTVNICVQIWKDGGIYFQVKLENKLIVEPSNIGMILEKQGDLLLNNSIATHSTSSVNEFISSPVPEKRKMIPDHYNLLQIKFKKYCSLQFRVYDDGIGYRWLAFIKDSVQIKNEIADFRFPSGTYAFYPGIHKRDDLDIFHTSFEELYPVRMLDSIRENELAFNPVLVNKELQSLTWMIILECSWLETQEII